MTVGLLKANFKIIMCAVLMTVRNNLVIGCMFHNLRKLLSLYVCNHISGGQMRLRNVAVREAQTRRTQMGHVSLYISYECLSDLTLFFFFQTIIHQSVTYGTVPAPELMKDISCSVMPWSVRFPFSPGSALYLIPGHISIPHIP